MNVENILNAIEAINDEAVKDARTYKRARYNKVVKWGAMVACVCLIITITALTLPGILREPSDEPNIPGGGAATPGGHPEGVDPIIESMAVYPATEDIRDVEDAIIENVDENTACEIPGLGNYLPTDLPTGYHFGKASLYETTMKSGTKYHLLRVTYTTGSDKITTAPANDNDGIAVSDPNLFASSFTVLITDYEPRTNKPIYSFENLQEYLESKDSNETFHFAYENIYIGISPDDLSAEEILDVVNSIP